MYVIVNNNFEIAEQQHRRRRHEYNNTNTTRRIQQQQQQYRIQTLEEDISKPVRSMLLKSPIKKARRRQKWY